jgi:hypothetical protein
VEEETTIALAPTLEDLHATAQALLEAAPHTLEGLHELIQALGGTHTYEEDIVPV